MQQECLHCLGAACQVSVAKAMEAVLISKFGICTRLQKELFATGDAFLLEHNIAPGRDDIWSDNHDGTGQNRLGLLLMHVRGEMQRREGIKTGRLTAWLNRVLDPRTGSIKPGWQQVVLRASACLRCALGEDRAYQYLERPARNQPSGAVPFPRSRPPGQSLARAGSRSGARSPCPHASNRPGCRTAAARPPRSRSITGKITEMAADDPAK